MKGRIEPFLNSPSVSLRSVFLYGTNSAYLDFSIERICQSYRALINSVAVVRCTQAQVLEQPDLLKNQGDLFAPPAELKIVIIGDCTDRILTRLEPHLASQTSVLLILPCLVGSVRKLKTLHESSKNAVFLGCYLSTPEERKGYLAGLTAKYALRFSPELKRTIYANFDHWSESLAENFAKLALYQAEQDDDLTVEDWNTCCQSLNESQVNELAMAIADRDPTSVGLCLGHVCDSGVEEMHILRGLLMHFNTLLKLSSEVAQGKSVHAAITGARPMIFFAHQNRFKKHLTAWPLAKIVLATDKITKVEQHLKQGLLGTSAAVHQLCLQLARD